MKWHVEQREMSSTIQTSQKCPKMNYPGKKIDIRDFKIYRSIMQRIQRKSQKGFKIS